MSKIKKILLALTLSAFSLLSITSESQAYTSLQQAPYYMGVYMYDYRIKSLAEEENVDYYTYLERHLKTLKSHGVNSVYLGGVSQEHFPKALTLYQKYGIAVIPQLDFAYFQSNWDDNAMEGAAVRAADFINKYADDPNIIAFSVKEEVAHKDINKLSRYYAAILAKAPKARFQLINSNLGAATDIPVPDPVIMGTDRYAFWWETSGGGYLATPGFSLNWVREQADRYYWQSAKRGADFSLVVTQGGFMYPESSNRIAGDGEINYPKTKPEQEKLRERVRKFAEEGRMGWKKFNTPYGPRYNAWKYYRLPKNAMKALAWTGVLQGAKSFYVWSYTPPSKDILETDFEKAVSGEKPRRSFGWITLAGRPGVDNPQLTEFSEVSQEIRRYENIITRMSRTEESVIQIIDDKNVFSSAFVLPGIKGRVIVLHNANIGTWPGGSGNFFKDSDDVYIDNEGNLTGYEGFDAPLDVHFTLKNESGPAVFDVKTGQQLTATNAQFKTSILPGSGVLLFIGDKTGAQQVQKWLK